MIKVKRSYPAPISLKHGRYDGNDVIEQLENDFSHKCYICGLTPLSDRQIEHLRPYKGNRMSNMYNDWDNLFLSCPHCNSVKNQRKYEEHVMDCCKKDPEKHMSFSISDNTVSVESDNKDDVEACVTSELMNEVFNLKNTGMRVYNSQYRFNELIKEMNVLFDSLEVYDRKHTLLTCRTLKGLLDRKSPFAEFKRYYIRTFRTDDIQLQNFLK